MYLFMYTNLLKDIPAVLPFKKGKDSLLISVLTRASMLGLKFQLCNYLVTSPLYFILKSFKEITITPIEL